MTRHLLLVAFGLALAGCAEMSSNTAAPAASAPAKVDVSAAANPDVIPMPSRRMAAAIFR